MIKTFMKKKSFRKPKKLIAFILVLAVAGMMVMSSCGGGIKSGSPVMRSTYGGSLSAVSSNIFSYYLSYVKTAELYKFSYMYGMEFPDSPELWNQEYPVESDPSIKTYGDIVRLQAVMQVQQLFATQLYCKEKNISLSKEQLNDIDVAIKNLIRDTFKNSKVNFNMTLARFGVNEQIYKEIKKLERLKAMFEEYLVSPNGGKKPVSDKEIWDKFEKEYVRVKHILIRTATGEYDEEGNPIAFSEEEFAERLAKADDIYNKITGGEDFELYYEESEDPGQETYPNGYCFSRNSGFYLEFEDAAFDMKIDEVRMIETDIGKHIMKKFQLAVEDIADYEQQIIRELENIVIREELKPYIDSIELLYDEINQFSIVTADTMLDYIELITT